jgi:hypothetical protein
MRLTDKYFLAFRLEENHWDKFEEEFMNIAPSDASSEFIQERMDNMVKWRYPEHNENFVLTETAIKITERIKVDVYNFDFTILNGIKRKGATIHVGPNKFYRYFTRGSKMHVMCFIIMKELRPMGMSYLWFMTFGIYMDTGKLVTDQNKEAMSVVEEFIQLMSFVELAETEIVLLKPGQSNHKPRNKGKVVNASTQNFHIVDSSWNKISINVNGFDVRGHFRWQRVGKRRRSVKLTFVKEHRRKGYVRKGGHLNVK